jgi:hypothetical protein
MRDLAESAGHSQFVWALVVIIIEFFGPLLYLAIARPALNAAGGDPVEAGPITQSTS